MVDYHAPQIVTRQISARLVEDVFEHTVETSSYVSETLPSVSVIDLNLMSGVYGSVLGVRSPRFLSHGIS